MLVIRSKSSDAWYNLAWEECLLDQVDEHEAILFFYTNAGAVVAGKNQNPWRECDLNRIQKDGIQFARRISGGGTVFHDAGNLNYSLILPRTAYEMDEVFAVVCEALRALSIPASRCGANGLCVEGRKFSGSAFCYRKQAALHHGTLLVDANLARMDHLLRPVVQDVTTKAVASRPAEVLNLIDYSAGITQERLIASLTDHATRRWSRGKPIHESSDAQDPRIPVLTTRNQSWEWLYGMTPAFTARLSGPEGQSLEVTVTGGLVEFAKMNNHVHIQELAGARFDPVQLQAWLAARVA